VGFSGESGMFLDLTAALSSEDYDTVRNTFFTPRPEAVGDTSGTSGMVNFEAGWSIEAGGFRAAPFAGVRFVSSDVSAYQENGAAMLNLTVLDQRTSGLVGQVGLEFGGTYSREGLRVVPLLRVAYEKELDKLSYGSSVQTSTGQIVTIGRGAATDDRITANAGLGLVGERFGLSVSYQGSIDNSDGKDNAVIGRVSYAF